MLGESPVRVHGFVGSLPPHPEPAAGVWAIVQLVMVAPAGSVGAVQLRVAPLELTELAKKLVAGTIWPATKRFVWLGATDENSPKAEPAQPRHAATIATERGHHQRDGHDGPRLGTPCALRIEVGRRRIVRINSI